MKKVLSYFARGTAVICLMAAIYFCHHFYTLYQNNVADTQGALTLLDRRLSKVETHKLGGLTPFRIKGGLSTTDQGTRSRPTPFKPGVPYPDNFFDVRDEKGGPAIRPELRLPYGSTDYLRYDIHIDPEFGKPVDAWLAGVESQQMYSKFILIQVDCPHDTNCVRLTFLSKPNASVNMGFDIVVLCER